MLRVALKTGLITTVSVGVTPLVNDGGDLSVADCHGENVACYARGEWVATFDGCVDPRTITFENFRENATVTAAQG